MSDSRNYEMETTPQGGVIPTAGKSAHQLWLDQGNVGTVIDFLKSLKIPDISLKDLTPEQIAKIKGVKGDKGDKGDKGEPGEKGNPGIKGTSGVSGRDGRDGIDGRNGVDGQNGTNGQDGINGETIGVNLFANSCFRSTSGWNFSPFGPPGSFSVASNIASVNLPSNARFAFVPFNFDMTGDYTYSFEVKTNNGYQLNMIHFVDTSANILDNIILIGSNWQRVYIHFTIETVGNYYLSIGQRDGLTIDIKLRKMKLERGKKERPEWTPSFIEIASGSTDGFL